MMKKVLFVHLLVGVVMVLALAGCSTNPDPVIVSVRSHNNATGEQDSQRIHVNGKRVGLRNVRAKLQSMKLSDATPVHIQVSKCDPELLGNVVTQLLDVEPLPTLVIENAQD